MNIFTYSHLCFNKIWLVLCRHCGWDCDWCTNCIAAMGWISYQNTSADLCQHNIINSSPSNILDRIQWFPQQTRNNIFRNKDRISIRKAIFKAKSCLFSLGIIKPDISDKTMSFHFNFWKFLWVASPLVLLPCSMSGPFFMLSSGFPRPRWATAVMWFFLVGLGSPLPRRALLMTFVADSPKSNHVMPPLQRHGLVLGSNLKHTFVGLP